MTQTERQAALNDQVQRNLMAYQDLYFRYLRACSEFPLCASAIEEPDPLSFGFRRDGRLQSVVQKWRKEFARRI
jgi:hypothetical protein